MPFREPVAGTASGNAGGARFFGMKLDWSRRGWARVFAVTVVGTLICIAFAFAIDSYSFATGEWGWGTRPFNNFIIPALLAPPLFFLFMSKLRELAIAHHELLTVATTDSLTSLLNRRAFTEMVNGYLERLEQSAHPSSDGLLIVDVDHFKAVNDSYGHDLGDEALKLIADTIVANVRETDLVGRMGGEEFGVFLAQQPPAQITDVAERIRRAINDMAFMPRGHRHPLSVSVGGVIFEPGPSFLDLYRGADERLYEAKRNGRNRVALAELTEMSQAHALEPQATLH